MFIPIYPFSSFFPSFPDIHPAANKIEKASTAIHTHSVFEQFLKSSLNFYYDNLPATISLSHPLSFEFSNRETKDEAQGNGFHFLLNTIIANFPVIYILIFFVMV